MSERYAIINGKQVKWVNIPLNVNFHLYESNHEYVGYFVATKKSENGHILWVEKVNAEESNT